MTFALLSCKCQDCNRVWVRTTPRRNDPCLFCGSRRVLERDHDEVLADEEREAA